MSSQSVSFDLGLVPVMVNREGGKVTLEKGHERVYKLEADSSSDKKSCFTIALGNGGQGAVLLAQEESSGSLVAVKQSFVRPADWEKAKREIDNLRALSGHQNIIEMVGHTAEKVSVGQPPQSLIRLWIGMEFIPGGDLERYRCRQPNSVLSEPDAQLVLHDASMGLQHMHEEKNILHRDVKPGNLFVLLDGKGNLRGVKLGDLGISKEIRVEEDGEQQHTPRIGTHLFAAPEVFDLHCQGSYGKPADIFGLGATILRMGLGSDFEDDFWGGGGWEGREKAFTAFLKTFPGASVVKQMVREYPSSRPSLEEILSSAWLLPMTRNLVQGHRASITQLETFLPEEANTDHATNATELEKLHADMAGLRLELEREKEEKSRLQGQLAQVKQESQHALGRNAAGANDEENGSIDADKKNNKSDGGKKDDEGDGGGGGDDDDDKDSDDDDLSKKKKARKAKGGSKTKKVPSPAKDAAGPIGKAGQEGASRDERTAIQALALSDDQISALIHQQRYDATLAEKIRNFHQSLSNIERANHKFLQPYDPSEGPVALRDDFSAKVKSADSNKVEYVAVESCFLVAAIHRTRTTLLQDFNYAGFQLVVSDTIELFLSYADYLDNHLIVCEADVKSTKKLIAQAPFMRGMSSRVIIDRCASSSKSSSSDSQSDATLSDAETITDAISATLFDHMKAIGVVNTARGARKKTASLTDVDTYMKPKNGAHLIGHLISLWVIFRGMGSISLNDLQSKTQGQIKAFARSVKKTVSNMTTVLDICCGLIAPALATSNRNKAIAIFFGIMEELKEMIDIFSIAAAECPIKDDTNASAKPKSNSNVNDGGNNDSVDDDESSVDDLPKEKLGEYLTVAVGVILSSCIRDELKSHVGFSGDVLELILRNSKTNVNTKLARMVWPGRDCFMFKDDLTHVDIEKICECVSSLVDGAQKGKGSSAGASVSSENYKSYEYWNKLSLLRLRSESVDLIARALML